MYARYQDSPTLPLLDAVCEESKLVTKSADPLRVGAFYSLWKWRLIEQIVFGHGQTDVEAERMEDKLLPDTEDYLKSHTCGLCIATEQHLPYSRGDHCDICPLFLTSRRKCSDESSAWWQVGISRRTTYIPYMVKQLESALDFQINTQQYIAPINLPLLQLATLAISLE